MKTILKSFTKAQLTPLVSLFTVVASVLVGIFAYQKLFGAAFVDFGPVVIWLAIAIPLGIFAAIFHQVRSIQRTEQLAREIHSRAAGVHTKPRFEDSRVASPPRAGLSLPEKDPFENL
jgi:hypothetical protein